MNKIIDKIREYIKRYKMLDNKDKILLGVSGGADSMCLLSVMQHFSEEYQLALFVLHIHHGLRQKTADEDAQFVEKYCKSQNIPCQIRKFDVRTAAKESDWTLEEAGRNLRYQAMREAAEIFGCNKIAVAHHQNDIAETVLFQMFRGTGLSGVCGISPVRGNLIRPLLGINRAEIESYLTEKKILYCTDETNFTEEYSRNKIRLRILPYVEKELNSQAVKHIAELAEQMQNLKEYINQEVNLAYCDIVQEKEKEVFLDCFKLERLSPFLQKELLLTVLERFQPYKEKKNKQDKQGRKDITSRQLESILSLLQKPVGKTVCLPKNRQVERTYHHLKLYISNRIERQKEQKQEAFQMSIDEKKLPIEVKLLNPNGTLRISMIKYNNSMKIPKNKYTKWFDYDKIGNMLKLRCKKEGDILQINRQGSHKLLNQLFIDYKIPRKMRDTFTVLAVENEILWVVGLRSSEKYLVCETTNWVLSAEWTEEFS